MSVTFPVRNGLKQRFKVIVCVLWPLLLCRSTIRKSKQTRRELNLMGRFSFYIHVDNDLLYEDMRLTRQNPEALVVFVKDVHLEVNAGQVFLAQ